MQHAAEVARRLLEIKAVKLNPNEPFTWASGILSPIYCDNRISLSYPVVRDYIKESLAEVSHDFGEFDVVAGVATAGIAHGALLADWLKKPFIYVRSNAKDHGRRNLIEGEVPAGARVLVVEDLISTGGSCFKVVEALQDAGCEVAGVLAIFQYNFPQTNAAFAEKGIPYATLTDYDHLLQEAIAMGYVADSELAALRKWRDNPAGWGALYAAGK